MPVITHTGLLEQHGAVFLLRPSCPVYVALSPVLDLASPTTRLLAAKHRIAVRDFVRAHAKSSPLANFNAVLTPLVYRPGALSSSDYHIKHCKRLFGTGESVEAHTALHELQVFERLARAGVECVVYPAARLMKYISPGSSWTAMPALVYPNIAAVGYETGFCSDPAWLAAVTAAVRAVHAAGVVHVDLWPCNIMWRPSPRDSEAGAGAAGEQGAAFEIRLVDFEASLEIGEPVPCAVVETIARNGCRRIYHPSFCEPNAVASVEYDNWFLALFALIIAHQSDPEIWCKHEALGDFIIANKDRLLWDAKKLSTAD